MSLVKLTLCCGLGILGWAMANEEFTLDIPQGTLKGLKTTTAFRGKPMYAFKGIPYAKPNVGPDKFRLPEPADPWNGVLDVTQHRSTCVFYCMVRQGLFGEEDCLFLNVYTPEVNREAGMPVMVWIHGGAYNIGSGDDDVYGPDFLIEKEVVLVTMNYRLGALGFLNTGDANAPGNAGLKDQVMALRWIKENIQNFGGCPNKVTIFGQSAGGSAVHYHMISPMSQGLFRNAIAESGSPLASWTYTSMPREAAFMLGEILGIKTTDSGELVNKLKEFSAKELVDASAEMAKHANYMIGFGYDFMPSSEADVGQEIFLPADPWELLKTGKIADVPFMTGMTKDEAGILATMVLGDPALVDQNFDKFLPNDLNITDLAKQKEIGESIKKFYFDGKSIASDPQQAIDLLGDVLFNYGCTMAADIISSRNSAPVYEYYFTYDAPFSFMKALYKGEKGAVHGDEMTYLFYSNAFKNKPMAGSSVEKMTDMMTEMWTNFAKESNPTPNMDGTVKVMWETKGKDRVMDINDDPTMRVKGGKVKERITFWANIYKDVLGDYYKFYA